MENIINKNLSQNVIIKELQVIDNTLEFVITTNDIDRYNEVMNLRGGDFTNFLINPKVLWQHDTDKPIGNATELKINENNITAKVELFEDEYKNNPDMNSVIQLVKNGKMKAASIGFLVKEYKNITENEKDYVEISKWELLEFSIVSIPANPKAVKELKEDNVELIKKIDLILEKLGNITDEVAEIKSNQLDYEEIINEVEHKEFESTNNKTDNMDLEGIEEKGIEEVEEVIIDFDEFKKMNNIL